jgi:hypothetical protein
MLNSLYSKPLYQIAVAQLEKNGLHRSVIQTQNVIAENNYALYLMIKDVEGLILSDPEILPHLLGKEAKRIAQTCLTSYWLWRVLRGVALNSDRPVDDEITRIRLAAKASFGNVWDTPIPEMKPEQIAQFTTYGFLLWDATQNAIAPNPIFF